MGHQTLTRRLQALEVGLAAVAGKLIGVIELEPGQQPLDALAGVSAPGYYFLIDPNQSAWLGQVDVDGTRNLFAGGEA